MENITYHISKKANVNYIFGFDLKKLLTNRQICQYLDAMFYYRQVGMPKTDYSVENLETILFPFDTTKEIEIRNDMKIAIDDYLLAYFNLRYPNAIIEELPYDQWLDLLKRLDEVNQKHKIVVTAIPDLDQDFEKCVKHWIWKSDLDLLFGLPVLPGDEREKVFISSEVIERIINLREQFPYELKIDGFGEQINKQL